MELIHCGSFKKIKLNDYSEIILGRRTDSVLSRKNISRSQIHLKSDCHSIVITNLGKNPIKVGNNTILNRGIIRIINDSDLVLPGNITYKICGLADQVKVKMEDLFLMDGLKRELSSVSEFQGWREMDGGNLIIYSKEYGPAENGTYKIAAFDMDGTLIKTRSGKRFPVDEHDWTFYSVQVVHKLQKLHQEGFKIVIFTNQGGIALGSTNKRSMKSKIEKMIAELNIPIQAYLASAYNYYRKPCPGMWFSYLAINKYNADYNDSFYVGDAAGREQNWCKGRRKDHSLADRLFARNVKLRFYTPEEFFDGQPPAPFKEPDFSPINLPIKPHPNYKLPSSKLEVIIMVGSPGSGKSHFVGEHLLVNGYTSISRDSLGSWQNCVKAMEKYLGLNTNVVIDNTNPNIQTREKYMLVGKSYNANVRCFIMESNKELCKHNNKYRQLTDKDHTLVTDIIINDYWKKYEEPDASEGYDEIIKVPFVPTFKNTKDKDLYNMYLN